MSPWGEADEPNIHEAFRQAAEELAAERAHAESLAEWIDGAEHHPGCSGGFPPDGENYRCKCGLDEIIREITDREAARPKERP